MKLNVTSVSAATSSVSEVKRSVTIEPGPCVHVPIVLFTEFEVSSTLWSNAKPREFDVTVLLPISPARDSFGLHHDILKSQRLSIRMASFIGR